MRERTAPATASHLVVHCIMPAAKTTHCTSTIIFPLFLLPSISSCAARISVHGNTLCTYVFNSPCPNYVAHEALDEVRLVRHAARAERRALDAQALE
jgi:hypothetical protein